MTTSRSLFGRMTYPASIAACGLVLALGMAGCKQQPAPITSDNAANTNGADPALANTASDGVSGSSNGTQVLDSSSSYTPQQSTESYGQQAPAPIVQGNANSQDYSYNQVAPDNTASYDAGYDQGESDQAAVDTTQAPPPLPEYDQPPDPDPNYIWTPGYWAWGTGGYYWVPGAWTPPPYYGALWTPPYWGWSANRYYFHHGYWGPHVGFYGGVNYGFGYIGFGFFGGYWQGHNFYYNRAVSNVNVTNVTNVYNRTVIVNNVHYGAQPTTRVAFNGGPGGINVRPRPAELVAMHETHAQPVAVQRQIRTEAAANHAQFYSDNHGRPAQVAFAAHPAAAQAHIADPPASYRQAIATHSAPAANRPGPNNDPQQVQQHAQEQQHLQQQQQQQRTNEQQQQQHNQELQKQNQEHTQQLQQQQHTQQMQQQQQAQQQRAAEQQRQNQQQVQQRQEQQSHPEPQSRPQQPAPHVENHPAPAPRPAAPAPHPAAPEPRPAAPAPHPAAPHPAAPAAHPEPAPHEEHPH